MKTPIRYLMYIIFAALAACNSSIDGDSSGGGAASSGRGGSMAAFTIVGDYLYTLKEGIQVYDISNAAKTISHGHTGSFRQVETIFPKDTLLFVGTTTGMEVYNIIETGTPKFISAITHFFSCDPVIADDNYAYVTLNNDNISCGRGLNQLEIYDITNIRNIRLVKTYPMTQPKGLGKRNDRLMVCDGNLKVYNATDVNNLNEVQSFDIKGAYDVIPYYDLLIAVAENGIYQYVWENDELKYLSEITE